MFLSPPNRSLNYLCAGEDRSEDQSGSGAIRFRAASVRSLGSFSHLPALALQSSHPLLVPFRTHLSGCACVAYKLDLKRNKLINAQMIPNQV